MGSKARCIWVFSRHFAGVYGFRRPKSVLQEGLGSVWGFRVQGRGFCRQVQIEQKGAKGCAVSQARWKTCSEWAMSRAGLSAVSRPDGRISANVSWAMTGAPVRTLLLEAGTTVRELKETLEESTGTPARFLELLCEGGVLPDDACASYSFARSEHLELLAMRKEPPRLLEYLLSDESDETEQRDVNVVKYIMAHDADGSVVNERDVQREDMPDLVFDSYSFSFELCTALHYAAAWGEALLCEALLDHSAFRAADALADVGLPFFCCVPEDLCVKSVTALHTAIMWSRGEICSLPPGSSSASLFHVSMTYSEEGTVDLGILGDNF